jgi:hypothetical protein
MNCPIDHLRAGFGGSNVPMVGWCITMFGRILVYHNVLGESCFIDKIWASHSSPNMEKLRMGCCCTAEGEACLFEYLCRTII